MNDIKTKSNGNGIKITVPLIKIIFGVVVVALLGFLWLTTELGAKADQTQVTKIEDKVVSMQVTLADINAKLDILLDK